MGHNDHPFGPVKSSGFTESISDLEFYAATGCFVRISKRSVNRGSCDVKKHEASYDML